LGKMVFSEKGIPTIESPPRQHSYEQCRGGGLG
jgi:hypothetical protein